MLAIRDNYVWSLELRYCEVLLHFLNADAVYVWLYYLLPLYYLQMDNLAYYAMYGFTTYHQAYAALLPTAKHMPKDSQIYHAMYGFITCNQAYTAYPAYPAYHAIIAFITYHQANTYGQPSNECLYYAAYPAYYALRAITSYRQAYANRQPSVPRNQHLHYLPPSER